MEPPRRSRSSRAQQGDNRPPMLLYQVHCRGTMRRPRRPPPPLYCRCHSRVPRDVADTTRCQSPDWANAPPLMRRREARRSRYAPAFTSDASFSAACPRPLRHLFEFIFFTSFQALCRPFPHAFLILPSLSPQNVCIDIRRTSHRCYRTMSSSRQPGDIRSNTQSRHSFKMAGRRGDK